MKKSKIVSKDLTLTEFAALVLGIRNSLYTISSIIVTASSPSKLPTVAIFITANTTPSITTIPTMKTTNTITTNINAIRTHRKYNKLVCISVIAINNVPNPNMKLATSNNTYINEHLNSPLLKALFNNLKPGINSTRSQYGQMNYTKIVKK